MMTETQVLAAIRRAVKESGSAVKFSLGNAFSASLVDKVLRGERKPPESILDVLGIGFEQKTVVRRSYFLKADKEPNHEAV